MSFLLLNKCSLDEQKTLILKHKQYYRSRTFEQRCISKRKIFFFFLSLNAKFVKR